MHRRSWLKWLGGAAVLGSIPDVSLLAGNAENDAVQPAFRVAHITDIHLRHDKGAPEGLRDCLHHLQSLNPRPAVIFNGGDTINDALMNTKANVKSQWELWDSIISNECCLNIEHCVGNHDVWGLPTEKSDPLYGKRFAMERMHLDTTYRSFDIGGWHFIVLDSTHEKSNGIWYTAKLGDAQMQWLRDDLQAVPSNMPVMIVSHIPILSSTVFFDDTSIKHGAFHVPGSLMHCDVREILDILDGHPNVKLCLSGHIHLQDAVVYNGIHFYCNGAVCGDWWNAPVYRQTPAGYAIVDLYADGSFRNTYVTYQ